MANPFWYIEDKISNRFNEKPKWAFILILIISIYNNNLDAITTDTKYKTWNGVYICTKDNE